MTFTRKSANLVPIEDTVFAVVNLAKEDKQKNGPEKVVDATIGSLYGEDGKLVAYDSVFNHYDAIDHRVKAAYAASFTGNPDYRRDVYSWVTRGKTEPLAHSVIATPGGSGAVSTSFTTFLDEGETVILPDIAWGSYQLMASQNNLKAVTYSMFDGGSFNLKSVAEAMAKTAETQDRLVVVVNDPCHNPTGYSMTMQEWDSLIALLNDYSKKMPVILIDDIAYIDYAYDPEHSRDYMGLFTKISSQVLICIAFSCSKTLTSYGLRCGAALLLARDPASVREAEIVFEKAARATWSNIPNAAMANFSWVTTENRAAFEQEKQQYVALLRERSAIFLKEAKAADLAIYPYREGFFITLAISDNALRSRVHETLIREHIYTVQVNHGIRVAVCSLPLAKVHGLAARIKAVENEVQGA
jgi:aspartate aminotransferase/aromatic-amino-acid transaminase